MTQQQLRVLAALSALTWVGVMVFLVVTIMTKDPVR
jgi:hypothetical protein